MRSSSIEALVLGDEVLALAPGDEVLALAPGDEVLALAPGDEVLALAPGDEVLALAPGDEVLALAPGDEVLALAGDEVLALAPGDEVLALAPGDEVLALAPGDEVLALAAPAATPWWKVFNNPAMVRAYNKLKKEISSDKVLIPYTPELPLILATDASPTGLRAVISYVLPDKSERPIAFASRSLTDSEKNYSQIDKESTAIVWELKKFFHYCYGREIILMTDHKPLTRILRPEKNLPTTSAIRLLHYASFLTRILRPEKDLPATSAIRLLHYASFMAGFKYEIIYRNTKEHANADYLSRLQHTKAGTLDEEATYYLSQIQILPVTRNEIRKETRKDTELTKIINEIQGELPATDQTLTKFTLQDGCLFNGIRVAIPQL
ncbi:RNase H-like domain found in reverse transcriptase [Popillia japonica]|uniref:RNase H-like domain found in reverse transcriptase n=1 Tax=Popillia japonica TaxID=7064 RepID=A0AAW1JBL9_POPJA